jgi:hypothetical protein
MSESGREGRKRGRLSRSGDFDRAYRDGRSSANRHIALYCFPRDPEEAGDEVRLGISLTLSNTTSHTHEFNVAEEFLIAGGVLTEPQPARADSIGMLPRLGPGTAVDGTLYFDIEVPEIEDPPLYLQWNRDGGTVRLAVPLAEQAPDHDHG